jgi:4'-phosphopantetheinyl transferase EntD
LSSSIFDVYMWSCGVLLGLKRQALARDDDCLYVSSRHGCSQPHRRAKRLSNVIDEILPDVVVAEEARQDLLDVTLFPEEEMALGHAVEKRRREFTTARVCARRALARLDLPPAPVLAGTRGEPRWPEGVVGSITHCEGYRACALARAAEVVTIGIDAEPNRALPDGVLTAIAGADELAGLADLTHALPAVHWDRLLFSAKEAVYKAWFPLAGRWLGFEDATLSIDPHEGTFSARLLVPGPSLAHGSLTSLSGRWLVRDELVLTAIALTSSGIFIC